jgi:hypothetical protein
MSRGKERGEGGERRKRIGAKGGPVGGGSREDRRRGAQETVCIKARSQARFLRPRDLFETKSSAACNDRASRSLGGASLLPTRPNSISSNAKRHSSDNEEEEEEENEDEIALEQTAREPLA